MSATPTPLLELRDGTTIFGRVGPGGSGTVAVDRVSLHLNEAPPRILNIVGESGSGKTTVARTLLGLNKLTSGDALYRGKPIANLTKSDMRVYRQEVQAVFQDPYGIYNPFYRIDRVFNMTIKKFKLAKSKDEHHALVEEALRAVSLRPPDVLGKYPHQLSGGERQRLMLARAYLLRPKLIVADEPVSMLDVAVRAVLMNILLDFKDKYGMSTVFITHDLSTAYYLGGDIMVMARGRVVEEGPVDSVMRHPAHPYTQRLLRSIPSPDPDRRWGEIPLPRLAPVVDRMASRDRCLFAERCPYVMERCWAARPPVYQVGRQKASCFLHEPGSEVSAAVLVGERETSTETAVPLG